MRIIDLLEYKAVKSIKYEPLYTIKINGIVYPINAIPNNLTVRGNLDLSYSYISIFPKNLHVLGDLNLKYVSLKCLPDDWRVDGKIFVNTGIEIPSNLRDKVIKI